MSLIHQPGSLLGTYINRPEIGKSSPQGAAVKPAVLRICPKDSEAVSGDETQVTCFVEPECHLSIAESCPFSRDRRKALAEGRSSNFSPGAHLRLTQMTTPGTRLSWQWEELRVTLRLTHLMPKWPSWCRGLPCPWLHTKSASFRREFTATLSLRAPSPYGAVQDIRPKLNHPQCK